MANIILRANIKDKNVHVEYKVIPLPLINTETNLTISPKNGSSISAKDLSHGVLPTQIEDIEFEQLGDNVSVIITFRKNLNSGQDQNVSLPIMSRSKLNIDTFKLIDNTNLAVANNIVTKTISTRPKLTNADNVVYNITNKLGKKSLLLSKTILTTNGYYFNEEPSYSITGNTDRYSFTTRVKKNNNGRIVEKTFNVYYTSPKDLPHTSGEDTIYFTALARTTTPTPKVKIATKLEEEKIYSFSSGRDIGVRGGMKKLVVRGVPGSKFKVIMQDGDKKSYNFKTGKFEAGGGMLEGVVPLPMGGKGYGEYIAFAEIPKSATASSVTTKLITDTPIDHDKLLKLSKEDAGTALAKIGVAKERKEILTPTSSITFSMFSSGFTIPYTDAKGTANLIVGPGKFKTIGEDTTFSIVIKAATAQVIRIERQPLFYGSGSGYVNWDSGSDKDDALTSTGVSILNDWYVADAKSAKYSINAKCAGVGKAHGTYTDGYKEIAIKGTISKITHGTGDIEVSLDLLNFLTLQSL
jgi:hypothetical protein